MNILAFYSFFMHIYTLSEYPHSVKSVHAQLQGAEPLSREPWNTEAGGLADCEDMPRKSLDIRFADHPSALGKGAKAPFPASGEDGSGQSPVRRVKGLVPCGFSG